MKFAPPSRRLAAGLVACAAASGSWALGVGRPQGLALIGRPLDVSVPISLDASEPVPECASVDVFYGDGRVARDRVASELGVSPAGAHLRVRSSWAVDEPVVTLYVQMGCSNRVSRRVVLLAEQPDAQGEVPRAAPVAPAAAVARPMGAAGPEAVPSRSQREPATADVRSVAQAGVAAPPAASRRAARRARATEVRPAAPPARLKLEPLDLAPAEAPLRLSASLAAPSQEATPQQRALAGAMWRALNAQPDDLLRDAQRLESLEKDLRALRQSIRRNDIALGEMKGQLQKAEAERYANPLVYALALLALAGSGAAAWAWRRGRPAQARAAAWWRPQEDFGGDSVVPRSWRVATRGAAEPPADPPPSQSHPSVDADLEDLPAPPSGPMRAATPIRSSSRDDFQASTRSLRAEELHDVQQEADFFVSLGEYERAIEVLRNHIGTNPDTSALAWLDLLEIYHQLGRRDDFEWVRGEFQHRFNAQVPPFERYRQVGTGLESYERAMSRIVALWPSRRVLDVIEESIFRGPGQDGGQAFSLQAYRELLLLHHLGTEVLGEGGEAAGRVDARPTVPTSGFGPSEGFSTTAIHPLSASPQSALGSLPGTGAYADIGLDIDLDALDLRQAESTGPVSSAGGSHWVDFDLPEIDSWPTRRPAD